MATYEEGVGRGKYWAKHADCDAELAHLQNLRAGKSTDAWRKWFVGHDAGKSAFERLAQVIHPHTTTRAEAESFWKASVKFDEHLASSALQEADFVWGFADGALQVWQAAGGSGERDTEVPDEDWLNDHGGVSSDNDT